MSILASPAGGRTRRVGPRSDARVGIVLCGGRSSRMGRAKAWLPWFGRTMVEHVVESLRPAVDEILVVNSAELELPPLDARVVCDPEPGLGPLAGIRFGLEAATARLAFVTSVDSPFLTREYVDAMFAIGAAAAPIAAGRVQVLSAVYPCEAWRKAAELLERGERRPVRLLEAIDFKSVDALSIDAAAGDPAPWAGFNTPSEYLEAVRRRDPVATATVELLGRAATKVRLPEQTVPVGVLGEVLARLPESLAILDADRVAKPYLVGLSGRDLVRDLGVPVGPGERVSVLDALAGG